MDLGFKSITLKSYAKPSQAETLGDNCKTFFDFTPGLAPDGKQLFAAALTEGAELISVGDILTGSFTGAVIKVVKKDSLEEDFILFTLVNGVSPTVQDTFVGGAAAFKNGNTDMWVMCDKAEPTRLMHMHPDSSYTLGTNSFNGYRLGRSPINVPYFSLTTEKFILFSVLKTVGVGLDAAQGISYGLTLPGTNGKFIGASPVKAFWGTGNTPAGATADKTVSTGDVFAIAITKDGESIKHYLIEGDGTYTVTSATATGYSDLGGTDDYIGFNFDTGLGYGNGHEESPQYGAGLIVVDAIPSDAFMKSMLLWQQYECESNPTGTKRLYPALEGI